MDKERYIEKELSGKLWDNTYKIEGDNKPIKKGMCTIGGVEYEVTGWDNQTKTGKSYIGLTFKVFETETAF